MSDLADKYIKERGIANKDKTEEAISTFFSYFRECMKKDTLPEIRLKGLGSFQVSISRTKEALISAKKKLKNNTFTLEQYQERENQLITFLNQNAKYEKFTRTNENSNNTVE